MEVKQGWKITCNHAYRPSFITAGYGGHFPEQRHCYGETFLHATAHNFQCRRNKVFASSKLLQDKGHLPPVQFPTAYTNDPSLVLANRKRTRERWMARKLNTTNTENTRVEEMYYFGKKAQQHREYYNDQTTLLSTVKEFCLPKIGEQLSSHYESSDQHCLLKQKLPLCPQPPSKINLLSSIKRPFRNQSTQREREVRDVFFENR